MNRGVFCHLDPSAESLPRKYTLRPIVRTSRILRIVFLPICRHREANAGGRLTRIVNRLDIWREKYKLPWSMNICTLPGLSSYLSTVISNTSTADYGFSMTSAYGKKVHYTFRIRLISTRLKSQIQNQLYQYNKISDEIRLHRKSLLFRATIQPLFYHLLSIFFINSWFIFNNFCNRSAQKWIN